MSAHNRVFQRRHYSYEIFPRKLNMDAAAKFNSRSDLGRLVPLCPPHTSMPSGRVVFQNFVAKTYLVDTGDICAFPGSSGVCNLLHHYSRFVV